MDAAEEAEPAHVRQVVTTHLEVIFKNLPVWLFPLTDKLLFCLLWSQITSASSGSDATGLDLSCHRLGAIPEVGLGGLGAIRSEGLWELEGRFLKSHKKLDSFVLSFSPQVAANKSGAGWIGMCFLSFSAAIA